MPIGAPSDRWHCHATGICASFDIMHLWIAWFDALRALRPACRRLSAFLWMTVPFIGPSCRPERADVTSLVHPLGFGNKGYRSLLHLLHSRALSRCRPPQEEPISLACAVVQRFSGTAATSSLESRGRGLAAIPKLAAHHQFRAAAPRSRSWLARCAQTCRNSSRLRCSSTN